MMETNFKPSIELRIVVRTINEPFRTIRRVEVLQQMWVCRHTSNAEWRDVPKVIEE